MSVLLRTGVMKYRTEGSSVWHPIILQANTDIPLLVTVNSFSSLPQTINSSDITAEHIVLNYTLSNPQAQNGAWTVTTAAGSVTISGTMVANTSTSATILLAKAAPAN